MYHKKIAFFVSLFALTPFAVSAAQFSMAEHLLIGNNVAIRLNANDTKKPNIPLTMENGLVLEYGDALSFGDTHGIPEQPISTGVDDQERRDRFMTAFNTFASDTNTIEETKAIMKIIHDELSYVENALKQGKDSQTAHDEITEEANRQMNCATGGGCDKHLWWLIDGRYLKLEKNNLDHFGENAMIAYNTGHELALETAIEASKKNDTALLNRAYAMNAFASHFLSDRLAAGHIRTPRAELMSHVSPPLVGSLLAAFMHKEENKYGIHVHNAFGNHWFVLGDQQYLMPENSTHRHFLEGILQASADEIDHAYQFQKTQNSSVPALLPYPDENRTKDQNDIAPLFYWDNNTQTLYRRENLSDPYDHHYTTNWYGWTTLLEIEKLNGEILPSTYQAALAKSELKEKAIAAKLITEPALK